MCLSRCECVLVGGGEERGRGGWLVQTGIYADPESALTKLEIDFGLSQIRILL